MCLQVGCVLRRAADASATLSGYARPTPLPTPTSTAKPCSQLVPASSIWAHPTRFAGSLPCTALESGWHHTALQPAFWGLAWGRTYTHRSLCAAADHNSPSLSVDSFQSQRQQCPHTSVEHGPFHRASYASEFWVCLVRVHQSAVGAPRHPHLLYHLTRTALWVLWDNALKVDICGSL